VPVLASPTVGEIGHITHCPNWAKVDARVLAGRTPLRWSVKGWGLIAHAIATF
jgi:hypothetical protein